ncbi:probable leucine-rich repeat receptor-like protein kinase At1g68400 [Selaginella moellendorffii]|uniref:probable leucine-rich repeat receptor-like protein kinase At1g68400 n=1 Tax=Selaginella moellendorffii TaxID=88036 RepID=UPI000D1CDF4D|nr:probable leucine-rich repeat receptor-like protein kinase At1g68400 [Selaginella moellendorffii]|eukprot:XP_024516664.1 probable leucine-rich repeat receptor-like protein kinase At1g68400 [Selaginella moellendorffii]
MKPLLVVVVVALAAAVAVALEVGGDLGAQQEVEALLAFKQSADWNGGRLRSWGRGSNLCTQWVGVSCVKGRVSKLVLEDYDLVGGIDSLLRLRSLRLLSLKNNALNGSIPPDLTNWRNVKFVFLGGNHLSGSIPRSISQLPHLWRLDLSNNRLSGPIPSSMDALTNLLTLRLEGNELSSALPPLAHLTMLNDFNVSANQLRGTIPKTLERFNASTFAGNAGLCGSPLPRCASILEPPSPAPSPDHTIGPPPPFRAYVPSSLAMPSHSNDTSSTPASTTTHSRKKQQQLSTGAIIAIVVGDAVVLVLMTSMFLVYYWRRSGRRGRKFEDRSSSSASGFGSQLDQQSKNSTYASKPRTVPAAASAVEFDTDHPVSVSSMISNNTNNKLVFVGGGGSGQAPSFDLEHLLRASAEMLGKGSLGSAYKAMLVDGYVVAVKRLKDVTSTSRKDFEQHIELIGRMRSPHLVQLQAYYYAKDEKLLVYDYMPNGSLHSLLHGNRGPGRVPVDWTTRINIALGAARGLAYIHQESGSHKIPHGNIKSSNVFLDRNGVARIGDFGLALLMNSAACSRLVGYRAPEHCETRRISQKGDVYSFGVLLLEILTGKAPVQRDGVHDLPRWVQSVVREEWTAEVFDLELMRYRDIEEEMVALLQTAMACVAHSPDARPKMSQVVRMIEEIRGDASPESFDSQSQLSSSQSEGA